MEATIRRVSGGGSLYPVNCVEMHQAQTADSWLLLPQGLFLRVETGDETIGTNRYADEAA